MLEAPKQSKDTTSVLDNYVEAEQLPQVNYKLLSPEYRGVGQQYTPEERLRALAVYAETGSATTASKYTAIPKTTIHGWLTRDQENTDLLLDGLRTALRYGAAHIYAEIAVKSAEAILDRLQNGDEVLSKQGDIVRVKVKARDLAAISSIAADKWTLITGSLQGRSADKGLPALADRLVEELKKRGVAVEPGALSDDV